MLHVPLSISKPFPAIAAGADGKTDGKLYCRGVLDDFVHQPCKRLAKMPDAWMHLLFQLLADTLPVDVLYVTTAASLALTTPDAAPMRQWLRRFRNSQKFAQRWRQACARSRLDASCRIFVTESVNCYDFPLPPEMHLARQTCSPHHMLKRRCHDLPWLYQRTAKSALMGILDGLKVLCVLQKACADTYTVVAVTRRLLQLLESTGICTCPEFSTYWASIHGLPPRAIPDSFWFFETNGLDAVWDDEIGTFGMYVGWIDMVTFEPHSDGEQMKRLLSVWPQLLAPISHLSDVAVDVFLLRAYMW